MQSSKSATMECTCWIVTVVLVALIGAILFSEWGRSDDGGRERPRREPGHRYAQKALSVPRVAGSAAAPSVVASEEYDETEQFMLAPPVPCASKHGGADIDHLFEDTGADLASYKKVDMNKVRAATNVMPVTYALSDTSSATSPPARTIGLSDKSWMQLMSSGQRPRVIGTQEIAFGGSSHLETLRSGLAR